MGNKAQKLETWSDNILNHICLADIITIILSTTHYFCPPPFILVLWSWDSLIS